MNLPIRSTTWALFLDFDGCIVDIAPTPWSVRVPKHLPSLLMALRETFGGALAIVTGRTIGQIDSFLGTAVPAVAALHGLERRTADGEIIRPVLPLEDVQRVRALLEEFAAQHQGIFIEDKKHSVALHYRLAPSLKNACKDALNAVLTTSMEDWQIVESKFIYDIRPCNVTKGTAIDAFMRETPFLGRTPLFCGDDVADEDGFAAVNAQGGLSICVGSHSPTQARVRVETVTELLNWLTQVAAQTVDHLQFKAVSNFVHFGPCSSDGHR